MIRLLLAVVVPVFVTLGCSNSDQSATHNQSLRNSSQNPNAVAIQTTVQNLFEALRNGDEKGFVAQFSPQAQRVVQENQYEFNFEMNKKMTYQIMEIGTHQNDQIVENAVIENANEAYVDVKVEDTDATGEALMDHMTLALRLENGRWGVIGIVGYEGDSQPRIVMDLESSNANNFYGIPAPAKSRPESEVREARQPTVDPFRQ